MSQRLLQDVRLVGDTVVADERPHQNLTAPLADHNEPGFDQLIQRVFQLTEA